MGKRIMHYEYLAKDSIRMLYEQLPTGVLRSLGGQNSLNLPVVGQLALSTPGRREPAIIDQVRAVEAHLAKHEPEKIGTIDDPRMYIKGTMPMYSCFLPTEFLLKRRIKPEFIYYGGSTGSTILGLAGPVHNLRTKTQASRDSEHEVSSAQPYLVRVLADEFHVRSRFKAVDYDDGEALACIEYMEEYNRKGKQLHNLSFLATVKLNSDRIDGLDVDQRIILASPIYMAYAD